MHALASAVATAAAVRVHAARGSNAILHWPASSWQTARAGAGRLIRAGGRAGGKHRDMTGSFQRLGLWLALRLREPAAPTMGPSLSLNQSRRQEAELFLKKLSGGHLRREVLDRYPPGQRLVHVQRRGSIGRAHV